MRQQNELTKTKEKDEEVKNKSVRKTVGMTQDRALI